MENRRKTLVINKKVQYQYGLLAASLTVLVANSFLLIAIVLPGSTSISIGAGETLGIGLFELLLISAVWYASIRFSLMFPDRCMCSTVKFNCFVPAI